MFGNRLTFPLFLCAVLMLTVPDVWANHSTLRSNPFNTNPVNTSGQPTSSFRTDLREMLDHEIAQYSGRLRSPFVYAGGLHTTGGSCVGGTCTSPVVTNTEAFVPERIEESGTAIGYVAVATGDICWTIISADNNGIAGWTRVGSTAYYYQCEGDTTPNQPALPPNSTWLMDVRISSSTITTVNDLRRPASFALYGVYRIDDPLYGAVCNGTTDDTTAIQAALNAASEERGGAADGVRGGIVESPHGICRTGALTWYDGVSIKGQGKQVSEWRCNTSAVLLTQAGGATNVHDGTIKDIKLNGNSQCTQALVITDQARWTMENVIIDGFTTRGINAIGSLVFRIEKSEILSSVIGITASTSSNSEPNAVVIRDTSIQSNTTYGVEWLGGSLLILDNVDAESNGTAGNASTGGVRASGLCANGEGIGIIIENSWLEGNHGHSAIRFQAAAAAPCWHIVRNTHIITGTRTYGVQVSGSNVSYILDNVVAQNAATADFDDDSGISRGVVVNSQSTSASFTTVTTRQPEPAGQDDVVWNYQGNITFNMGTSDTFLLSGTGVRLGLVSTPASGVDVQLGNFDGTQTTDDVVIRIASINYVTTSSRGAGMEFNVPHVAAGAANNISLSMSVRNDANTGEGALGILRLHKDAGSDLGQWEIRPSSGAGTHVDGIVVNATTTAEDMRLLLYDVTGATGKQVVRGAADSCGTGYRCLRILN